MFSKENFMVGVQKVTNIQFEMSEENFLLKKVPREFETAEEYIVFVGVIPIKEIIELQQEFKNKLFDFKDSMLISHDFFEIAIETQDRFFTPRLRNDRISLESVEHNYSLSISKGSKLYLYSLLCQFATNPLYESVVLPNRIYSSDAITSIDSFFDLFRIITAKIISPKKTSIADFKRMLNSYLFNISYNKDLTLSAVDFTENRRTVRIRTRRNGQLFPYKTYNHELTKYYRQALATDIPFTQYLAFYHVAEFFIPNSIITLLSNLFLDYIVKTINLFLLVRRK
ncbi:MAG: hypothetical protein KMY54_07475 [Erysipelothrix sp.]|nr:hypothetical protein [Erysipelothrix sp.]